MFYLVLSHFKTIDPKNYLSNIIKQKILRQLYFLYSKRLL